MLPMRITDAKRSAAVRRTSAAGRSAASGALFQLATEPHEAGAAAVTTAPGLSMIGDISTLLAVQGVDNEAERRRNGIKRGHETLDALDALKVDLLAGRLSPAKVRRLQALVARERQAVDDPKLHNILDHIELRARVELAKLEQRGR